MAHSRKLIAPIVSAAVATIGLTSFAIVALVRREGVSPLELFAQIWPLTVTSAVAVTLVMSVLYRALLEVVQELQAREAAAQHAALHDPLTGLPNRALLEDRLDHAITRCKRDGEKIALLMLDLDRFKSVNDTYGHQAGDAVLKQLALILKGEAREIDRVGRYGGEEFMLLLPGTALDSAVTFAERVRKEVEGHTFTFEGGSLNRTASFGVSAVPHPRIRDCEALVRAADDALYVAKETGRNRVIRFDSDEFNEHTMADGLASDNEAQAQSTSEHAIPADRRGSPSDGRSAGRVAERTTERSGGDSVSVAG